MAATPGSTQGQAGWGFFGLVEYVLFSFGFFRAWFPLPYTPNGFTYQDFYMQNHNYSHKIDLYNETSLATILLLIKQRAFAC